jgi:uncharacterized protein YbdZ (MbtH family)
VFLPLCRDREAIRISDVHLGETVHKVDGKQCLPYLVHSRIPGGWSLVEVAVTPDPVSDFNAIGIEWTEARPQSFHRPPDKSERMQTKLGQAQLDLTSE